MTGIHDFQGILRHPAGQLKYMDPCQLCLLKGFTEFWVRVHIGPYLRDAVHLNGKGNAAPVSLLPCADELADMLDAALCRCIGEISDAVELQGAALDLQQIFLLPFFHIEVDT